MHRLATLASVAVLVAGCGRYEPPTDGHSEPVPTDLDAVTRCADVPTLPTDREVSRGWGGDEKHPKISLSWYDDAKPEPNYIHYNVSMDDPTCDKRPDIRKRFAVEADAPQFENARIVVRPGQDRAYVGYTIIGRGENLYAQPDSVRAVRPDGQAIEWKHQTITGGPPDIVASGRQTVEPGTEAGGGDADYVDASAVTVGETVRVTFEFIGGGPRDPAEFKVDVPFRVVAAG